MPWCVVLVCSWRRLWANRHSLPFPWTLSGCLCFFAYGPVSSALSCPATCSLIGGGAHWPLPPCVLPLPPCPIFPSLLPFPLPWSVVLTEPPDVPYFIALCRIHTEGNFPRRCPGASKQSSQTSSAGPLPNSGFWALGCPPVGFIPRLGHITTLCLFLPALSPPCGGGGVWGGGVHDLTRNGTERCA